MQPVIRPVRAGAVKSRPPWRLFRSSFLAALAAIAAAFIAPCPAFAQPPENIPSGPIRPGIFSLSTGDVGISFLSFIPMLVMDSARMRGPEGAGARFGIGLGAGYLNASGDFIEFDTAAGYPFSEYRRGIDVSSLACGAHVFAEYSLGRLVLGLHSGFFNASGGGYDYLVGDYSIDAGFRSRF